MTADSTYLPFTSLVHDLNNIMGHKGRGLYGRYRGSYTGRRPSTASLTTLNDPNDPNDPNGPNEPNEP